MSSSNDRIRVYGEAVDIDVDLLAACLLDLMKTLADTHENDGVSDEERPHDEPPCE